jgi:hypothetical protein
MMVPIMSVVDMVMRSALIPFNAMVIIHEG